MGRSAAELRVHQTIHSNEKAYICDYDGCDYKTKTKTLLKRWVFLKIICYFYTVCQIVANILIILNSGMSDLNMNQARCNRCIVSIANSPRKSQAI